MDVKKVGSRGYLFTFEDPYKTTVYAIIGKKYTFICDTFLGDIPMLAVKEYLQKHSRATNSFIVFITHADYDHYWGNSVFGDSLIISHNSSPQIIAEESAETLEQYASHKRGEVKIVPPNLVFEERLLFKDEGIEMFHTPGHTKDSSSLYDHVDHVLVVGDNIESPFPYINRAQLDEYIETLSKYLDFPAKVIVSGHDDLMNDFKLIKENIAYLKHLQSGTVDPSSFERKQKAIHFTNVKSLGAVYATSGHTDRAISCYKEALNILEFFKEEEHFTRLQSELNDLLKELLETNSKKE